MIARRDPIQDDRERREQRHREALLTPRRRQAPEPYRRAA